MLVIDNLETQDDYTRELTLESRFGGRLVYVVANRSAVARFRPLVEIGGSDVAAYGPDILLTPQSSFIDKLSAVQFRSAVAGSPARIVAQLSEPGDILPASGTPFTGTLAASGAVTTAEVAFLSAEANAPLTLGVAMAAVPGATTTFSVVGSAAEVLVVYTYDWIATGAGFGICIGNLHLNGVGLGAQALYEDDGSASQRLTITNHARLSIGVGANTIDLRARKTGAGGVVACEAGHTNLVAVVLDK